MKKPIKLVMDKFPYLQHFKTRIANRQQLIDLNNKIKEQIPLEIELTESIYEKRKLEKELVLLEMEQAKNYKQLNDDEIFFKNFKSKMVDGIDKVNASYDKLVAAAKSLNNPEIEKKFKEYANFDFTKNWESKVSFYLELEQLTHNVTQEIKIIQFSKD